MNVQYFDNYCKIETKKRVHSDLNMLVFVSVFEKDVCFGNHLKILKFI